MKLLAFCETNLQDDIELRYWRKKYAFGDKWKAEEDKQYYRWQDEALRIEDENKSERTTLEKEMNELQERLRRNDV